MKIEFYDKETGEAKQFQEHYVLDADSCVHRVIQRGHGEYLELDHSVGWRIIDQWQPIETAPKDGTDILFFWKSEVIQGWWCDSMDFWRTYEFVNAKPEYWMPLPPNPQSPESNPQS